MDWAAREVQGKKIDGNLKLILHPSPHPGIRPRATGERRRRARPTAAAAKSAGVGESDSES